MAEMEAYNRWLDNQKTYILVTGASRGLGKTIALRFAPLFGEDSVVVLIARDLKKLQECQSEIAKVAPKVKVDIHSCDLSRPKEDTFRKIIQSSLTNTGTNPKGFSQAIIVHNAASIGKSQLTEDASDPDDLADYLLLNVASAACLNSVFLKTFTNAIKHRMILNITSLAAFKPILSLAYYNTGKAARDQFFRTLADEDQSVTVLSYSPGPLQTDMIDEVMEKMKHPQVQKFIELKENKQLLTCDQTTTKLIDIIRTGDYESGIRVDYYGR